MALVLDEPDGEDLRHDLDGVPIVMDKIASQVIETAGAVHIYLTDFGPRVRLQSFCSG